MQPYLNGVYGCDVVRTPSLSNGKKAPPVSIEAIGGTHVEDPGFDEINVMRDEEDEFEVSCHLSSRCFYKSLFACTQLHADGLESPGAHGFPYRARLLLWNKHLRLAHHNVPGVLHRWSPVNLHRCVYSLLH